MVPVKHRNVLRKGIVSTIPRRCESQMCENVRHLGQLVTATPLIISHMWFLNANVNLTD